MHHFGWTLVRGRSSYRRPPFILTDAPTFETVEELVEFWHTRIAPQKVREAMELIKFNEGLNESNVLNANEGDILNIK